MDWNNLFYFLLGFATATVLIVGFGFFWLKRRWKTLLFGLGSKLFGQGIAKVAGKVNENAQRKAADSFNVRSEKDFREVGRQ